MICSSGKETLNCFFRCVCVVFCATMCCFLFVWIANFEKSERQRGIFFFTFKLFFRIITKLFSLQPHERCYQPCTRTANPLKIYKSNFLCPCQCSKIKYSDKYLVAAVRKKLFFIVSFNQFVLHGLTQSPTVENRIAEKKQLL